LASSARPLLIAHVHLAVWPYRNVGNLPKRLGQGAVLIPWLIEQAATIKRVRRRAKRRRNLRAGLIKTGGGSGNGARCRIHDFPDFVRVSRPTDSE
jgi:hypothetical protein